MKHLCIFVLFLSIGFSGFSQNYPIAVDDTADIRLGEYLTINVTANDYNPSGLPFKIVQIGSQFPFTDSTITCYLGYDEYYNLNGYKSFDYKIEDENGIFNPESFGRVTLNVINHFYDTLDINNVRAPIFPSSGQFWIINAAGGNLPSPYKYEYPKGSRKYTIFTSNLWIGGMDQDGQLRVAGGRYRQNGIDFWPGPICSYNGVLSIDTASVYKWNRVWKLNKSDIEFHVHNWNKPGYEPIENVASWPAHGNQSLHQSQYLAPFIDVDGDGIYDPYSGDYPLIRGDQCVFFVINDLRQHTETEGNAIGIEVHGMLYQFNQPDDQSINNTTFLHYKIFNRSSFTLTDTYIGIWTDIDIGYADDDFVGCDVTRGMYFGYNGDEIDGTDQPWAYGENSPAQGVAILGGPKMDSNELDDPTGGCDESINGVGFGDNIIDNERYGMNGFIYNNNESGYVIQSDPSSSQQYYNYLKGIWRDETPLQYGGTGIPNGGSYGPVCRFMFPGLTDPCLWGTDGIEPNGPIDWREETGNNGEPNSPSDRRGLGSMGPFTFLPNSVQTIDVAYVTALGDNGPLSSVELLKVYVDSIRAKYIQNTDDFGTQYLGVNETLDQPEKFKFFPNPVEDLLQVEYNHKSQQAVYAIYDLYGRLLISENINTSGQFTINVSELKTGLYIISVLDDHHQSTGRFVKR